MKRDMELIRKILFEIEKRPPFESATIKITGYDMQAIAYHCEMLYEEGYIKEYYATTCDNFDGVLYFGVQDLTWQGQDLIETIRNDTVWKKTMKTIEEKTLAVTIGTVKTIATAFITATTEGIVNAIIKNGGQL